MMEDLEAIRRKQLERHNGRARTWWHYNRWTLLFSLWIIAVLMVQVQVERRHRAAAMADAKVVFDAAWPMMGCWTQERATSFVVAGGSQQQVYDAIYSAEQQMLHLREAYMIARTAKGSEEFWNVNAGKVMP